ncbi:MAG: hypothetical protein KKC80_05045 [Candidatus Margulisbacteria bacterium]|nr:hypothetical protein [Candidatus Margulisiibacteriota bacterium]MBU1617289.1 hypothetical protein [Candidatus Margulisiibacteriota bacterium]
MKFSHKIIIGFLVLSFCATLGFADLKPISSAAKNFSVTSNTSTLNNLFYSVRLDTSSTLAAKIDKAKVQVGITIVTSNIGQPYTDTSYLAVDGLPKTIGLPKGTYSFTLVYYRADVGTVLVSKLTSIKIDSPKNIIFDKYVIFYEPPLTKATEHGTYITSKAAEAEKNMNTKLLP